MKYELEVDGPLTIEASMRASDLLVNASERTSSAVVSVTARSGGEDAVAATRVELVDGRLVIEAPRSDDPALDEPPVVSVEIDAPAGTALAVETGRGAVAVTGSLAEATVRTGSGGVTLEAVDRVVVASGSGDVRIARVGVGAEVRSGSGSLELTECHDLTFTSGSGDAVVGSFTGAVSLTTASGALTVQRASAGEVRAETASGDVTVHVVRGTAARLDCASVTGQVTSELGAADAPAQDEAAVVLHLRTISGDIRVPWV